MPSAVAGTHLRMSSRPRLASVCPTPMHEAGDRPADQGGHGRVDTAGDPGTGQAGEREGEEPGGPDQPGAEEGMLGSIRGASRGCCHDVGRGRRTGGRDGRGVRGDAGAGHGLSRADRPQQEHDAEGGDPQTPAGAADEAAQVPDREAGNGGGQDVALVGQVQRADDEPGDAEPAGQDPACAG